jgi:hypothetical protein
MRFSTRSMSGGRVSSACRLQRHRRSRARAAKDMDWRAGDDANPKGLNDVEEAFHGGASGPEHVVVIRPAPIHC